MQQPAPGNNGMQTGQSATPRSSARAISAASHPDILKASHQRSAAFGLNAAAIPDFTSLSPSEMRLALEQSRSLHNYALPVMEHLFQQISGTHSMVVLTNRDGHILHTFGDNDFLEKADKVAIRAGVNWAEQSKGTNAIGTALTEQAATLIHGADHYLEANHFLTCSAAPIFDSSGQVAGVLDVTGDYRSYHKQTMTLVRMSAQVIENQLFSSAFNNAITIHFHSRAEFIGTLMEGIAAFTRDGRFLSANRYARFLLGLTAPELTTHTFTSLFGLPLSALFDHYRTNTPTLLNLDTPSRLRVHALGRLQGQYRYAGNAMRSDVMLSEHGAKPAPHPAKPPSQLKELLTGDVMMENLIAKVSMVLGHDVPLLITGETGTGKELLAKAIHHDSPRSGGPFIAVNCAAIPEALIESELFGYEDGAFTGARKKGNVGKILQAQGGSLFLDEIGDMPLHMQARLLRVLQEKTITPLGGGKPLAVDIQVISATNHHLQELIKKQLFREDLYYRLNGMLLVLPPLRQRSDLLPLVEKILKMESPERAISIADDVLHLFAHHEWPGNIRQLTSLLRTAIIIAGAAGEIRQEHLPADFLEQANEVALTDVEDHTEVTSHASGKLQDLELNAIQRALQENGGNISAAARSLGISRNTIYRKAH